MTNPSGVERWVVEGVGPRTREIAEQLARRSGITLGEWLNRFITLDERPEIGGVEEARAAFEAKPMTEVSREELDAKLALVTARSEARFNELGGEARASFEALRGDIRELRAATASKGTVIGTGIALFLGLGALFLAALSFGSQMFGQGFSASAIADQAAAKAIAAAHAPVKP